MRRSLLLTLQRLGARVRYRELHDELDTLVREYPELQPARRPRQPRRAAPAGGQRWSEARRKEVSRRMKRYWAKRRQQQADAKTNKGKKGR